MEPELWTPKEREGKHLIAPLLSSFLLAPLLSSRPPQHLLTTLIPSRWPCAVGIMQSIAMCSAFQSSSLLWGILWYCSTTSHAARVPAASARHQSAGVCAWVT